MNQLPGLAAPYRSPTLDRDLTTFNMADQDINHSDMHEEYAASGAIVDVSNFGLMDFQHSTGPEVYPDYSLMQIRNSTPILHQDPQETEPCYDDFGPQYGQPGRASWVPPDLVNYNMDDSYMTMDVRQHWDMHPSREYIPIEQNTNDDSAIDMSLDKPGQDQAVCPVCNKAGSKKGLDKHIKRVHKKEEYTYECPQPQCGKKFFSKKDLNDHISSHKELRDIIYLCPNKSCDRHQKGYSRKDNAFRHVKVKHKELIELDTRGEPVKGCVKFPIARYRHMER